VADIIVGIGTGEPHRLLESLARRMLDTLAARIPAAGFRIELRKLSPPSCPGHPAYSAVRLERRAPAPAR
jgi:dihydroneopterin aldolase